MRNLRWDEAKSGNGRNLRLAPADKSPAGVWVGQSWDGAGYMIWPTEFANSDAGISLNSNFLAAFETAFPDGRPGSPEPAGQLTMEEQVRNVLADSLTEIYRNNADANTLYGAECSGCSERLHPATYKTCWHCSGRSNNLSSTTPNIRPAESMAAALLNAAKALMDADKLVDALTALRAIRPQTPDQCTRLDRGLKVVQKKMEDQIEASIN